MRVGAEYRKLHELTGPTRFLEIAKAVHNFSERWVYQILKLETVHHVMQHREKNAGSNAKLRAAHKARAKAVAEEFIREFKEAQPEEVAAEEAAFKESDCRQDVATKLIEAGVLRRSSASLADFTPEGP